MFDFGKNFMQWIAKSVQTSVHSHSLMTLNHNCQVEYPTHGFILTMVLDIVAMILKDNTIFPYRLNNKLTTHLFWTFMHMISLSTLVRALTWSCPQKRIHLRAKYSGNIDICRITSSGKIDVETLMSVERPLLETLMSTHVHLSWPHQMC